MKNTTRARRLGATSLLALSFVLALSGCGGGGGGTAAASTGVSPIIPANPDFDLSGASSISNLSADLGHIVVSNASSIASTGDTGARYDSHSTRTEQLAVQGQIVESTVDSFDLTWTGAPSSPALALEYAFAPAVVLSGTAFTVSFSGVDASAVFADDTTTQSGGTLKRASISGYDWDFDNNGSDDGTLDMFVLTDYARSGDTNYTSAGVWLYQPASSGNYHMGAFADSSLGYLADITSKTGTATYNGFSIGYMYTASDSSAAVDRYHSDISLTADFGDASGAGTISGTMSNFADYSGTNAYTGSINLTGELSDDTWGGSGTLSGTINGSNYTGNWGGHWISNDAGNDIAGMAGTVGGATSNDSSSFTGAFIAYQ